MVRILAMAVEPDPSGAWRIELADGQLSTARGVLHVEQIQGIDAAVRRLAAATPLVVRRGQDGAVVASELSLGQALGETLATSTEVQDMALNARAQAAARGDELVLLMDLRAAHLRRLPWELIAWQRGELAAESTRTLTVVRRQPGQVHPELELGRALRVLWWAPDQQDSRVGEVARQHHALWRELQIESSELRSPSDPAPPQAAEIRDVLHIVCHGGSVEGQIALLTEDARRPAAAVAASASPLSGRVGLVVLDVCGGAAPTEQAAHGLVSSLLSVGFPAVLCPLYRTDQAASIALARGLYRALAGGASLSNAVVAGRRAVLELADPCPDARWHNHRLHVSSAAPITAGPWVKRTWRPAGWPIPSVEAAEILDEAWRIAERQHAGYVGVDHVMRAITRVSAPGPLARAALQTLGPRPEERIAELDRLHDTQTGAETAQGTPRLLATGQRLRAGFSADELLVSLLEDRRSPLTLRLGLRVPSPSGGAGPVISTMVLASRASAASVQPQPEPPPAMDLEVVGGPEDGRRLHLAPDQRIGRWDPTGARAPEVPLYLATARVDSSLSRHHALWLGRGWVRLLSRGAAHLESGPQALEKGAEHLARVGELLQLGAETWLVGVGDGPSDLSPGCTPA